VTEKTSGGGIERSEGRSREEKWKHIRVGFSALSMCFWNFTSLSFLHVGRWPSDDLGLKYSKLLSNYCHFIGEFAINNTF
jgi:hypothetical protein